jgi:hypothetical protein
MNSDAIDVFLTKGYLVLDGTRYHRVLFPLLSTTEFKNFTGDEFHPSTNQELINILLLQVHLELAADIVEKYFSRYEMGNRKVWESVNRGATVWHNDLADHTNTFFLLYHNDTSPESGGAVSFRYNNIEEKIYPSAGTLVFFNQENNFQHRAENSKNQRIVSSYYFNIDLADKV